MDKDQLNKLNRCASFFKKIAQQQGPQISQTERDAIEKKLMSAGLWRADQPVLSELLMKAMLAVHNRFPFEAGDSFKSGLQISKSGQFSYPVQYTGPSANAQAGAQKAQMLSKTMQQFVGSAQSRVIKGPLPFPFAWNQWLENLHLVFE